ncbi:MAG: hypothetical protein L3K14_00270 [Thermoplasmata archaeon]|nr:hypothetical protein [Thermoplasmata archaeon]
MSRDRVSSLPKSTAAVYLRKASDFARSMEAAVSDRNFDAAGLAGIHAVISACDALTVTRLGLRSTAQDHSEVLKLLVRCNVPTGLLTQVRATLAVKNRVEYEARQLSEEEAYRLRIQVRRVLEFVEKAGRSG